MGQEECLRRISVLKKSIILNFDYNVFNFILDKKHLHKVNNDTGFNNNDNNSNNSNFL